MRPVFSWLIHLAHSFNLPLLLFERGQRVVSGFGLRAAVGDENIKWQGIIELASFVHPLDWHLLTIFKELFYTYTTSKKGKKSSF
jgi:hypothetical protein